MMEAIVSIHEEGPKLTDFGVIVHYDNLFPLFLFYSVFHVDICEKIDGLVLKNPLFSPELG